MSPLNEQINQDLPWLFGDTWAFHIMEDSYDPKHFRNSIVTLESEFLNLRFVRDRGQISAELASPSDPEWRDLMFVLEAIQGKLPEPRFDLQGVSSLLRDNFPALIEALGPRKAATIREIKRRMEERRVALSSLPSKTPAYVASFCSAYRDGTGAGDALYHVC